MVNGLGALTSRHFGQIVRQPGSQAVTLRYAGQQSARQLSMNLLCAKRRGGGHSNSLRSCLCVDVQEKLIEEGRGKVAKEGGSVHELSSTHFEFCDCKGTTQRSSIIMLDL